MSDITVVVGLPFDRLRVSGIERLLVVSLSNHRLKVNGIERLLMMSSKITSLQILA